MKENIKFVKVLGERNTGTNYLSRLISKNFDIKLLQGSQPMATEELRKNTAILPRNLRALSWQMMLDADMRLIENENLGWKHAVPDFQLFKTHTEVAQQTLFLVISKEPVSWLKSFYKRPYHCLFAHKTMSFSQFIRHPWIATRKENIPNALCSNIVELWNVKYRGWLKIPDHGYQAIFIHYEDLISDFERTMETLAQVVPGRRHARLLNIENSTKNDGRSSADFANQYARSQAQSALEAGDTDFIEQHVCRQTLQQIGYA